MGFFERNRTYRVTSCKVTLTSGRKARVIWEREVRFARLISRLTAEVDGVEYPVRDYLGGWMIVEEPQYGAFHINWITEEAP